VAGFAIGFLRTLPIPLSASDQIGLSVHRLHIRMAVWIVDHDPILYRFICLEQPVVSQASLVVHYSLHRFLIWDLETAMIRDVTVTIAWLK
jgi:hypothetical protein